MRRPRARGPASDARDLALGPVGAEQRVDPAQPGEGGVEASPRSAVAHARDRHAHDVSVRSTARRALSIAPCSESSQISLVEVAPDTTSTSALPAFSADSRRIGSARALSASVCGPSPLSSTVSMPVRRRPVKNAPHLDRRERRGHRGPEAAGAPRGGGAGRGAGAPRRLTGSSAEFGFTVRGGSVSKRDEQRRRPRRSRRGRRARAIRDANRSVTMWRRETPERREARARRLGHRRRAAHVDVARRDVGHQRAQVLGARAARPPVAWSPIT